MKLIPLTQGQFAMVDDEDYDFLIRWKWYANKSKKTASYYAISNAKRTDYNKNANTQMNMHRLIMKVLDPNVFVDHKDGDGLNNQRSNLRIATNSQNNMNKRPRGSSKYLGVSIKKSGLTTLRWGARIAYEGKIFHLGSFPYTPEGEILAAKAYDEVAKKYFGEFANLNFKPEPSDHEKFVTFLKTMRQLNIPESEKEIFFDMLQDLCDKEPRMEIIQKFKTGDKVKIIKYGSKIYQNKKNYREHAQILSEFSGKNEHELMFGKDVPYHHIYSDIKERPEHIIEETNDIFVIDLYPGIIGRQGIIQGSYHDLYGSSLDSPGKIAKNKQSYALIIEGAKSAWYNEDQLELIN